MSTAQGNKPPSDLEVTFERMTPTDVRRWLSRIATTAGITVALLLVLYWGRFGGGALSRKGEDWAYFGEYFGGTAGPILTFLTVLALVLTLVLQVRQLEDSREQLKASQAELERSRELQVTMAQAMSQQAHYATMAARVAALGASLSIVSEQLSQMAAVSERGGPVGPNDYQTLLRRKGGLAQELLDLTDNLAPPSATALGRRY